MVSLSRLMTHDLHFPRMCGYKMCLLVNLGRQTELFWQKPLPSSTAGVRVNLAVHRMQLIASRCFLITVHPKSERSLARTMNRTRGCVKSPRVDPPDCLNPRLVRWYTHHRRSSLPENAQKCSRDGIIKHSLGEGGWGRSADLLARAFFLESSCLLYNRTKRR